MKKLIWLLPLALVLVGGCLKIESNEADGIITISGGKVDSARAINNLMRDWQLTHEVAGSQVSTSRSTRVGLGFSTREGLILPSHSKRSSSHSYVTARTPNGKQVQFTTDRSTGEPTTITITVEEGAPVTVAEVTAELARRLEGRGRNNAPLTFLLAPLEPSEAGAYESQWTASGDWSYPARNAQFQIRTADGRMRSYGIFVDGPTPWMARGGRKGPVSFEIERRVGTIAFEGQRSRSKGSGIATFDPNAAYVAALTDLISDEPTFNDLVNLFFSEMDLDAAAAVRQAWGSALALDGLMAFTSRGVAPEYIRGAREAGYGSSPEQVVKLHSYHIPIEMLVGFKQAGYNFSADEIIKIDSYHLKVDDFVGFRDAGYDYSIDEMIKADSYHIPVAAARTYYAAGYRFTLDQLIKLDSYHIKPEEMIAFRDGGYDFSIDEMIKADSYHISAAAARTYHDAGYRFNLDELIKLDSYNIRPEAMIAFRDAGYDFSIDEMIKANSYRIPAAMARTLSEGGFSFNLDELIKLDSYHIKPEEMVALKEAGYSVTVDGMIKVSTNRISAADAVRLRQLGYGFSLDDIVNLKSAGVSTRFMLDVYDPNYEPFTADELIGFRRKGIDVETIRKIRTGAQ